MGYCGVSFRIRNATCCSRIYIHVWWKFTPSTTCDEMSTTHQTITRCALWNVVNHFGISARAQCPNWVGLNSSAWHLLNCIPSWYAPTWSYMYMLCASARMRLMNNVVLLWHRPGKNTQTPYPKLSDKTQNQIYTQNARLVAVWHAGAQRHNPLVREA